MKLAAEKDTARGAAAPSPSPSRTRRWPGPREETLPNREAREPSFWSARDVGKVRECTLFLLREFDRKLRKDQECLAEE